MKTLVPLGLIFLLGTVNCLPNVGQLVEEIEEEISSSLLDGQSHVRRKRKATPVSRMMEARNELLKRSVDKLNKLEENLKKHDAVKLVKRELQQRQQRKSNSRRPGGFGGHDSKIPSIPNIDDTCSNPIPACDANYKFRNVTGTCNNIKNPFLGSANIGMRRYLPAEYEDGINVPVGGIQEVTNRRKRSPRDQQKEKDGGRGDKDNSNDRDNNNNN